MTKEQRTWIYTVGLAVIAVVGGYGLIADEKVGLWVGLLSALVSTGTAVVHRPTVTEPKVAQLAYEHVTANDDVLVLDDEVE